MRVLLSVLALLALVVAGLMGVWWLGGPDVHRWVARRVLELVLERDIHVDGTFEVELRAEPLLQLTGLRIESPPWAEAPTQLQIERARIQIALRPLLRRVLVLPLVALEGVTVALETAADGRHSWQSDGAQAGAPPHETRLAIPFFDRLSVSDATVAYRDQRYGRRTRLHLVSLTYQPDDASGHMRLDANGDIDGQALRIKGTSGDLEAALAATHPYPLELEIQLPSIEARLAGTADNVARATGLDLRLGIRIPSLLAATKAWNVSVPADAEFTADARLDGDLAALSLTEVRAEMSGSGGDHLEFSGGLGDVWAGSGLDGRVRLKLNSAGALGKVLLPGWRIPSQIEAAASVAGSMSQPVLDEISADIQGPGGSRLRLAGSLRLAATAGVQLEDFDLTSTLLVPDPSAFADRLGFDPSRLGALRGDVELSLANQRVEAGRLRIDARDFGSLRLESGGTIGALATDGAFHPAPVITFAAEMTQSGPLLGLIDPNAPELGPVRATGRLVGGDQGYRLDALELHLGTSDKLAISAQGNVGPLLPGDARAAELDLAVRFGWPSSQVLRTLVSSDLPELGKAEGEFILGGTLNNLLIHGARLETRSDAGLVVTATGGIASVQTMAPFTVEGIALELEARAPSTTVLAQYLGHELPDFGPVRARTHLGDGQGRSLALTAIRLVAGPAEAPSIEMSGTMGDVVAFENVELKGDFEIPATDLLDFAGIHGNRDVGRLYGKFDLSDADGSLGVEHLEAEIRETPLLSLTTQGLIDDLKNLDQVRFQTSFEVSSIAKLAEVFDAGDVGLGPFRFDGELSGDGRRFDADGRAILGETHFDGVLRGDFRGARPSFRARLHSPNGRLVDLGLTPEASRDSTTAVQATVVTKPHLFGREPLPLESLRKLDLDLEVQLDSLEGIALAVDQAKARVTLKDGKLELSRLRFDVVGGYAEVNAEVDARAPTPKWRLQAATDDLQLGDAWRQLEAEVPLSGELDLILDLQAIGRTPQDLASSLSGDLSLALQRGQIRSRLFGLTTMNPVRWLVARSTRRGYSKINCFVMRLQAVGGVAKLLKLVLDTPNAIAAGEGSIDFARETIDLRIRPSAKQSRVVGLPTPFAIRGSLVNPLVEASATGATVRTLGRVVVSPVNLLGALLPFVNDRGRDQDNPCLTLSDPEARRP